MVKTAGFLALVVASLLLPACGDDGDTVTNILGPSRPASGRLLLLNNNNQIFVVSAADPSIVERVIQVSGLGAELLEKIKFHPLTGELYGITENGVFATVDAATGAAGFLFNNTFAFTGTFAFDFHPLTGVISMQTSDEARRLIDPETGQVTTPPAITPAGTIAAVAYGPGPVLYGLDIASLNGTLVQISDTSVVTTVGPVQSLFANADFDISPGGTAYAAYTPNDGSFQAGLFTLNLATGAPTRLGTLTPSQLRSLTVVP